MKAVQILRTIIDDDDSFNRQQATEFSTDGQLIRARSVSSSSEIRRRGRDFIVRPTGANSWGICFNNGKSKVTRERLDTRVENYYDNYYLHKAVCKSRARRHMNARRCGELCIVNPNDQPPPLPLPPATFSLCNEKLLGSQRSKRLNANRWYIRGKRIERELMKINRGGLPSWKSENTVKIIGFHSSLIYFNLRPMAPQNCEI